MEDFQIWCDNNETNKGIIMMFKNNEIPVCEYSELYKNIEDIEKWMDEKMGLLYESRKYYMV